MMASARTRLGQGVRALFAFAQPVDLALAGTYLLGEMLNLFGRMKRAEQLHSLNVLRAVLAQGATDDDLAVAALLHDVGKSRFPIGTLQKSLAVVVRTSIRTLFERLSQGDPNRFWSRPFTVYAKHPEWGAELARTAGASENAIWLIAHHQDKEDRWSGHPLYASLIRLQAADDAN